MAATIARRVFCGNSLLRAVALTPGEPAGIGPDLLIMLAQQQRVLPIVAIADAQLLNDRAQQLRLPIQIEEFDSQSDSDPTLLAGKISVHHIPTQTSVVCGELNEINSATLDQAVQGCQSGAYDALVTGPLHKGIINDAGIPFTGHTEYLALKTGAEPVMMLATNTVRGPLRVALATTHLPLSEVSDALTKDVLERAIRTLHHDLKHRFNIADPRILVCGLNPHAGEGGHMGTEEIDTIEPVLKALTYQGLQLLGPLPADTLFTPQHLDKADAVLAMFHDQGLPVLKFAGFGQAVNITLGLPIIRTSVDHGTALDKAGTGKIDTGSLSTALEMAGELVTLQKANQPT